MMSFVRFFIVFYLGFLACDFKFSFRRQHGNADPEFFSQGKKTLLPLP
jgi:hypothetical protein